MLDLFLYFFILRGSLHLSISLSILDEEEYKTRWVDESEEESNERRGRSEEREREDIKAKRVCSIDRQLLSLVDAVTRSRRRHRPAPDASLTQPPTAPQPHLHPTNRLLLNGIKRQRFNS